MSFDREMMQENTQKLLNQDERIHQIQLAVEETDKIADNAMLVLGSQGETIKSQIARTQKIGDAVQGARTILGRMSRTQVIQSVSIIGIILFLLMIIGIILFFVVKPYFPTGGSGSK